MGDKPVHKSLLKTVLVAAVLSALGVAGNALALPVSFGVAFIFGSIFSLLAVSQLGLWPGLGVALVASSYTYVLWGQPYAIIVFTAEILWMGIALRRGRTNLLLIDGCYWLILGSPLNVLFFSGIMDVGVQQTMIVIFKQGLNGLFNTLIAWILLSLFPVAAWMGVPVLRQRRPYGQVIFQIAAAFLMVPSLGLLLLLTNHETTATQQQVTREISIETQRMTNTIGQWVATHINAVRVIAELEASLPLAPSAELQEELQRIHGLFPDFRNVMLCDATGVAMAYDPPTTDNGRSTIGTNFADRAWFKELSTSLQPNISDAFVGRSRVSVPMVSLSVPIIRDGKLSHFGLAAINLDRMRDLLKKVSDQKNMTFTIIDRNNKVVISTDQSRNPLEALVQLNGHMMPVSSEVDLWMPAVNKEANIMQTWKNAYYLSKLPVQGTPWTVLAEYPVAPMQKYFFELAIHGLLVVTAFFAVMIMLAALVSRLLTEPILSLARVSKNLPVRIARHEQIQWPQSDFTELSELIDNFQYSARTIDENLVEINEYNLKLEETVQNRTVELSYERQRLEYIIEGTNIGTWEWNVQSGATIFNERWAEIVGYRLEELQPISIQTWLDLAHPEDLKLSEALLERHFSGELDYYDCECRMRHKDGHWVWAHDRGRLASRTGEGKPLMMSGTHEDITAQKVLQARLLMIMEEQNIILENTNIGILMVKERKNIWVNKKMQDIFGYSQDEMVNASTRIFYPSREAFERIGDDAYSALAAGKAYHADIVMSRKDGTDLPISLSGQAVNPSDPQGGSIWIFEDITQRKDAERRLREKTSQLESLTRTLEQRVEEEVTLRLKGEQLLVQQSKLAAMGEMLGAISHQWRQPLNALAIIVQNIRDAYKFDELDRDYIEGTVQKSMEQIRHMSSTIDDFRNFFRPDKQKASFNAVRMVGNVLGIMSAQLSDNQIRYRLNCHTHNRSYEDIDEMLGCEAMISFGYQNEFQHVILNIVNNARDAILSRRDGNPEWSQAPGQIDFDFYHPDTAIVIEIADNGGGIAPDILDRVFEPYFTTKEPDKGTGLGLYMSKVIMEHMNGRLSARNSDQGAVFILELPGRVEITEGRGDAVS